eukprot:11177021-Lingulodinium_polyedra.AAC.1
MAENTNEQIRRIFEAYREAHHLSQLPWALPQGLPMGRGVPRAMREEPCVGLQEHGPGSVL